MILLAQSFKASFIAAFFHLSTITTSCTILVQKILTYLGRQKSKADSTSPMVNRKRHARKAVKRGAGMINSVILAVVIPFNM